MLVFDMDGVLVDVTESYRETIARTVEHFTGEQPTRARSRTTRTQGGWNDDWKLSHHMVREAGVDVDVRRRGGSLPEAVSRQRRDGLILREQWMARAGLFDRLSRAVSISPLSPGACAGKRELTLDRFAPRPGFDPIIGMDDVDESQARAGWPAQILQAVPRAADLVHRRYGRRCALRASRRRALHRHRRASNPRYRRSGVPVPGRKGLRHSRRHQLPGRGLRLMRKPQRRHPSATPRKRTSAAR